MAMLEEDPDFDCEPRKRSWPLWSLGALVFLATVGVVLLNHREEVAIANKETRCPSTITSVTAVLIDVTDRFQSAQEKEVREKMQLLSKEVPKNGRLDLYMLDKGGKAVPVFSLCSPGVGSGRPAQAYEDTFVHKMKETLLSLASNDTKSRQIWERLFRDKVDAALVKAMAGEESLDSSPIVAALRDVSAQSFSCGQTSSGGTLIVVSDMLSMTKELNQYVTGKRAVSFEQFRARPTFAATRPTNLSGVTVQVFYVRRDDLGHLQTQAHKEFWREFFKSCGAKATDIAEI